MATHPSPFHRQRQSTKSLDPTGQTAKFLYTILKQLDLKNIDWNEVAGHLDITNGHAARMRWSRFRAQIEGLDNSYSRKGGRKKDADKKRKKVKYHDNKMVDEEQHDEVVGQKRMKTETESMNTMDPLGLCGMVDMTDAAFGALKFEPVERTSSFNGVTIHHPTMTTIPTPGPSAAVPLWQRRDSPMYSSYPNAFTRVSTPTPGQQQPATTQVSVGSPGGQQWSQQSRSVGYRYPYHQSTGSTPYFTGRGTPVSNQPYSHVYGNQFRQQRAYYSQPFANQNQPLYFNQIPTGLNDPINTVTLPQHRQAAAFGTQVRREQQPSSVNTGQSSVAIINQTQHGGTSTALPQTQIAQPHNRLTEETFELASQASYPWPHTEASLQQLNVRPNDTVIKSTDTPPIQPSNVISTTTVATPHNSTVDINSTETPIVNQTDLCDNTIVVKKEPTAEACGDCFQTDPANSTESQPLTGSGDVLNTAAVVMDKVEVHPVIKAEPGV